MNNASEQHSATPTGAFEARMSDRMERAGAPSVAIAVVHADRTVWQGARGVANAITGEAATPETAYLWFSMTKIATATAIMQLVETGVIALDTPARTYLPDVIELSDRVSVRHLLNHSSGIGNPLPLRWVHRVDHPGPDPRQMLRRLLARHGKLHFAPGTRAAYTNVGYLVLGEVITAASGIPYRRYVVEQLLRPLGARSTGFAYPPDLAAAVGHHARFDPLLPILHLMLPKGIVDGAARRFRVCNPFYVDGSAYGGLIGPVTDAARLVAAHLNGGRVGDARILTPESTTAMQHIETPGKKYDLGFGWFREHADSTRGLRYVEHLGGGAGFASIMRLHPDRQLGFVVMANATRFNRQQIVTLIEQREWSR